MEKVEPIRDKKQINALKVYLKGQSIRNYLLFEVGISSALRISDILKLKVSDVWDGNKPKTMIRLREKKTDKFKEFPITKNLQSAIKEYINEYHPDSINEYLFISRKGINEPITRQQAHVILSSAARELGIDNISTHSMRKTWAYWQYKSGLNIMLIMEALNHSSLAQTRKYIGITQDELNQAYLDLNL